MSSDGGQIRTVVISPANRSRSRSKYDDSSSEDIRLHQLKLRWLGTIEL